MITADYDAVPNDIHGYRVAFISAFRDRGIFPSDVAHLAVDSLFWEPPPFRPEQDLQEFMEVLDLELESLRQARQRLRDVKEERMGISQLARGRQAPGLCHCAWLSARRTSRTRSRAIKAKPAGSRCIRYVPRAGSDRTAAPSPTSWSKSLNPSAPPMILDGGSAVAARLLIDAQTFKPRYLIRKRLDGSTGLAKQVAFRVALADNATLRSNFYSSSPDDREPFALLHGRH